MGITKGRIRPVLTILVFSLVPVLAPLLIFPEFFEPFQSSDRLLLYFLSQSFVAVTICFGVITGYYLLARRFTTPVAHPDRWSLRYLLWGTICVIFLVLIGLPLLPALATGVLLNFIIAVSLRKQLLIDTLFSGLGMAAIYLGIAIAGNFLPTYELQDLWRSNSLNSILIEGFPVTQILVTFCLGILMGPLFLTVKDDAANTPHIFRSAHLHVKRFLVLALLLILGVATSWLIYPYALVNQVVSAAPATELLPLNSAVHITFQRPVEQATLRLSIAPEVNGSWQLEGLTLQDRYASGITFTPEKPYEAGVKYTVQVDDMRSLLHAKKESFTHSFTTEIAPEVSATVPKSKTQVKICTPISVEFNKELSSYWRPEFVLNPSTEITVTHEGALYHIKPKDCLEQGTQYSLATYLALGEDDKKTNPISVTKFETNPAPGLSEHSPTGSGIYTTTDTISMKFTQSMKQENPGEFISITPAVSGEWKWGERGKLLEYQLKESLQFATRYTITLKKGFPELGDGFLQEDNVFSFSTIGPVAVLGSTPVHGTQRVEADSRVSVVFSQQVDHASAEANFSLSPSVPGYFSWNGNQLYFHPTTAMNYSTTYTVGMKAGVKSIHGQNLPSDFSANFLIRPVPPPPPVFVTFGRSEQGRAISGYVYGKGNHVVLLFGALHGNKERSTGLLLEQFIQDLNQNLESISKDKTIIVLPIANPDGYLTRTDKLNANEVNLNLNFDTTEWQDRGGDENHSAGSEPFSESESRVIRDIVANYGVDTMVSYHAIGGLVNPEYNHRASEDLASIYAQKSGYYYYTDPTWDYFGTATRWFRETRGGAAITVELSSYGVADWWAHKNALYWLVQ